MNRNLRSRVLSALLCVVLFCHTTCRADDQNTVQQLEKSLDLLVVAEQATLMVGDEPSLKVPQGTLLTATHRRGPWKYIPSRKGWVHDAETVSLDEAVDYCTKRFSEGPSAQWLQLRGAAFMARKNFVKAAQDLERAYDLGDSAVSLHLNLGICYRELGQDVAALREFSSVIEAFPDEMEALSARGEIFLDQANYAGALIDFTRAVELSPNSADLHNNRGVALRLLGRYEEAVEAYTAALSLNAEFDEALTNRGYALKSLGKDADALADYERAVQLAATPESKNDLAWLLATSPVETVRDPKRALTLAEEICRATQRRNGEFLDTLAAAYAAVGRFDAALEAGSLAAVLLEGNPGSKQVLERIELYRTGKPFVERRDISAERLTTEQPSPATGEQTPRN